MTPLDPFLQQQRVAYFSMEIALHNDIPTYSGGLGVLAGDTLRSAADLGVPLVAVTLVSHQGYFRQIIDAEGRQVEQPDRWSVAEFAPMLGAKVAVHIEGRRVWIASWLYVVREPGGRDQPVILLDTNLEENAPEDRHITDQLYGGDTEYRFKQEIVLGIGGVRMLAALGFRIFRYHMNEGHAALLAVELLRRSMIAETLRHPGDPVYDLARVRELCCFTTHTPVEAGHDRFDYALVERVLGDLIEEATLRRLGGEDSLNMTRLALNVSKFINGVAHSHAETSRAMFPGYQVHAITNGAHPVTWTTRPFKEIFDREFEGWRQTPEILVRADGALSDDTVWNAHAEVKNELMELVRSRTGIGLDPSRPIVGFARRMTAYKRPMLLFSDLERLLAIAERTPFQIVMAGKAHPRDEEGKAVIRDLHALAPKLAHRIPLVFLPGYDMNTALHLVAGADLWLNTPLAPMEASGTSGMKAAMNGVPSLSVLDGWWVEGCDEGVTGWAIEGGEAGSQDADALYRKLGDVVLPLYYRDRVGWVRVMKGAIARNASYFHSHRMMRRYAAEAYLA
ncbi:MAG TPA: alpha-glucan family phosphorylase [Pseudomonadales bacterium]